MAEISREYNEKLDLWKLHLSKDATLKEVTDFENETGYTFVCWQEEKDGSAIGFFKPKDYIQKLKLKRR